MSNPQFREIEKLLASNDLRGAEDLCRNAIQHVTVVRRKHCLVRLGAILLKSGRFEVGRQFCCPAKQRFRLRIIFAAHVETCEVVMWFREFWCKFDRQP